MGRTALAEANAALGDLLGQPYSSLDELAKDWSQRVRPIADKYGVELASRFFLNGNVYYMTPARSEGAYNWVFPRATAWLPGLEAGYIHTHPTKTMFDRNDLLQLTAGQRNARIHQTAYVSVPGGRYGAIPRAIGSVPSPTTM